MVIETKSNKIIKRIVNKSCYVGDVSITYTTAFLLSIGKAPFIVLPLIKIKVYQNTLGGRKMKGYNTQTGYMGYVDGEYILFASESDYYDFLED